MKTFKLTVCFVSFLALTGCMSLSPALPWNWGKHDAAAKVKTAEAKVDTVNSDLLQFSQFFFYAGQLELESDPTPSPVVKRAISYIRRGNQAQSAAIGAIDPGKAREVEKMVTQRASDDPKEQAKGEKALAKLDNSTTDAANEKAALTRALLDARNKLNEDYHRARQAEATLDAWKFWFWIGVAGYAFVHFVLPCIAQGFPQFRALQFAANALKSVSSAHL